ncbi:hypothetical protein L2E82_10493 [Cichorium intybus]|uniref:Uncharacterized protein n=1 Tax=Cichorium intybus TaxID=13427 RepID=A0ACB9GAV4_CICIN|nr:hypothetical protein L2E82_10493 [Cichorium intybus]
MKGTISRPVQALQAWLRRQPPKIKVFLAVVSAIAALVVIRLVVYDHDNLFIAAEAVHALGISVLIYKLATEKTCAVPEFMLSKHDVDTLQWRFNSNSVIWAVCVYLDSVSVLSQLRVMQNTKIVEPFTAHYIFALGVARFLSCAHWILQVLDTRGRLLTALGYGMWPSLVLLSEIVQTFILADFCRPCNCNMKGDVINNKSGYQRNPAFLDMTTLERFPPVVMELKIKQSTGQRTDGSEHGDLDTFTKFVQDNWSPEDDCDDFDDWYAFENFDSESWSWREYDTIRLPPYEYPNNELITSKGKMYMLLDSGNIFSSPHRVGDPIDYDHKILSKHEGNLGFDCHHSNGFWDHWVLMVFYKENQNNLLSDAWRIDQLKKHISAEGGEDRSEVSILRGQSMIGAIDYEAGHGKNTR